MVVSYYIEFNEQISEVEGVRVACAIPDKQGNKISLSDNTVVRATMETGLFRFIYSSDKTSFNFV